MQDRTIRERADGPVQGLPRHRSATFTKTDMPLRGGAGLGLRRSRRIDEDQAMQSLADVFRYVPGATAHQGEGKRDQGVPARHQHQRRFLR